MDTYIPSRFFVDEDAADFKAFKQAYDALYKEDPVKSLPGFAAMGYDLGCYLAGQMEGNADINRLGDFMNAVQLDINPERAKAWTGILNGNVYLIRYTPYNTIDRIRL